MICTDFGFSDLPVVFLDLLFPFLSTLELCRLGQTNKNLNKLVSRFISIQESIGCGACGTPFVLKRDVLSYVRSERSVLFEDGFSAGMPFQYVRNVRSSRDWSDLTRKGVETFCLNCGVWVGVELSRRVRAIVDGHGAYPYLLNEKSSEDFDIVFTSSEKKVSITLPVRHAFLITPWFTQHVREAKNLR